MAEITHRFVDTNGIRMHIAEAGNGPLVVLCHGFPESWYSWRHQLDGARGRGLSRRRARSARLRANRPRRKRSRQYTQLHLVGDIVGLVHALGDSTAVIVGHDWGAPVAWNAALWRPDVFRAVAALSVPVIRSRTRSRRRK